MRRARASPGWCAGLRQAEPALCPQIWWLDSELTCGQTRPLVFTQGHSVCNRSFFPCFDTPAVKSTYSATVRVSPLRRRDHSNPSSLLKESRYVPAGPGRGHGPDERLSELLLQTGAPLPLLHGVPRPVLPGGVGGRRPAARGRGATVSRQLLLPAASWPRRPAGLGRPRFTPICHKRVPSLVGALVKDQEVMSDTCSHSLVSPVQESCVGGAVSALLCSQEAGGQRGALAGRGRAALWALHVGQVSPEASRWRQSLAVTSWQLRPQV